MNGTREYASPKPVVSTILAQVAEVAGKEAAQALARAKGGLEGVYIPLPDNLTGDHWLVKLLGHEKAHSVALRIGGGHVEIPIYFTGKHGETWCKIVERLREGRSGAAIARELGVHERTVRRVRSRFEIHPKGKGHTPKP